MKNFTCKIVFLFVFAFTSSLYAAEGLDLSNLKSKASLNGEISIIVELVDSSLISSSLESKLTDFSRMKAVNSLGVQFKSSLGIMQSNIKHEYVYTPAMLMRVDANMLDVLSKNPMISNVYEDKWLKASLAESVDLVFPTHQTSPYSGNNEWAVAVLDTGVDKNHSFLKTGNTSRVISEACYSGGGLVDPRVDSFCPGNSFSSTAVNSGLHCSGYSGCEHGTHVAGIAAGDGAAFDGVARLGKLIAIQVFTGINDFSFCDGASSCITAVTSDLIKGLERIYALRNTHKIAAVNLSLGGGEFFGTCPTDPTAAIINLLKSAGIATIVASGNEMYTTSISSPACVPNAIAVGASIDSGGSIDQRASYSNNSSTLDLYAPGSFITSSVPGGGFSTMQGTSMATPHVAGAFAVLRNAKAGATVNEIENILKSVGPVVSFNGISRRRLDVESALKLLVPDNGTSIVPILQLLLLSD